MAILRLKYVHTWHDKKSCRPRYFFRYRGRRWPLPGLPGSKEFGAAYDALYQQHITKREPTIAYAPATLGGVIERYLASSEYLSKRPNTQRIYRRILDRLKEVAGRGLIADLRDHHVRQIRQKFLPSTSQADLAVIVLRILWVFAKEEMAMQLGVNPASEIRRLHRNPKAYEPWPADVIAKFEDHVRTNHVAHMALLLLLYTGQRVGDVAAMKWSQYDGKGIGVRQQKTRNLLWIPCHTVLKAALNAAPRHSEFIVGKELHGRWAFQRCQASTTAHWSRTIHDAWVAEKCGYRSRRSRMHTAANRGGHWPPQLENDPALYRWRQPKEACRAGHQAAGSGTIKNEKGALSGNAL